MKEVLKFVIQQLKPHRKTVILCSVLAVLAAGLDTVAPILMGRGFDLAVGGGAFLWYGGALLGWFILRAIADRIRVSISRRGSAVAHRIRQTFSQTTLMELLMKPLAFHYGKRASETREKIGDLRWKVSQLIEGSVFDLAPAMLAIAAILTYLYIQDWRIGAVLTVVVLTYMAYTYSAIPKILKIQDEWWEANRKVTSRGWDALNNVLIVKSTSNEEEVGRSLERYRGAFERIDDELNGFNGRVSNVQNLIMAAGSFLVLLIALRNLAAGTFTFGLLTALTAFTFQIFGYLRWTQWQFRVLLEVTTGFRELKALLAEPAEDFESGEDADLKGGIEYRGVRFRYREDKSALEDVSFAVEPGRKVAIVGESGEGKTTLVDLLGRYYLPQGGEILLDGVDIGKISLKSLRSQMAYVPQDLTLFHETIGFNIRYGRPDASDEEVREAARLAHLDGFIEALPEKYATVVGERGLKLSGGERQRVALARAFLRDPKILILDEPTSNLDSKTEMYIQDALEKLMRGRTTFIIAHRLHTIRSADRILVLKDGRIAESGTNADLLQKRGAYWELLKRQTGMLSDT